MSITPNGQIATARSPDALLAMIPGQREPGSLTRFAGRPDMVQTMVDVTMDAAGRADRQREGGGAPSERRPAHVSRWAAVLARLQWWRVRHPPFEAPPAPKAVAVNPSVL
jgi:hypothetical protein